MYRGLDFLNTPPPPHPPLPFLFACNLGEHASCKDAGALSLGRDSDELQSANVFNKVNTARRRVRYRRVPLGGAASDGILCFCR